jgi:hypothetical protein
LLLSLTPSAWLLSGRFRPDNPLLTAQRQTMKTTITIVSLIGFLLFGAVFLATYFSRKQIEESATSFISKQVEVEVRKHLQDVVAIADKAGQLKFIKNKYSEDIEKIRTYLSSGLPELIAKVISDILEGKVDEQEIKRGIEKVAGEKISSLAYAIKNIEKLISGKYFEILANLIQDIRIFSGCNSVLFLIALIISSIRSITQKQALLPTVLLVVATIASSLIYIFGQDWFYTIIYNNYVGFGYLAYVGVIFLFQSDLLFNKARLTCMVFDVIGSIATGVAG